MLYLVHAHVLRHLVLGNVPRLLHALLPRALLLIQHGHGIELQVGLLNHALLLLLPAIFIDDGAQCLPLRLALRLLLVRHGLQLSHLVDGCIAGFIRSIAHVDDVRHVLLPVLQLLLQLLVDAVKDQALAAEVVDLLPQLLVLGDGLVELVVALLQAVLQDFDLLLHLHVGLLRSIHTAAFLPRLPDLGLGTPCFLIDLREGALLQLNLLCVKVQLLLAAVDRCADGEVGGDDRELVLHQQLLLQLVVLRPELLYGSPLTRQDKLRV
mmetsp:Transcript_3760/g.9744  ORF Transcript_3760/g.9744 Transcript_3760/m.9744 type:complete len:267 (+) Transcript_3760:748-1548(+)